MDGITAFSEYFGNAALLARKTSFVAGLVKLAREYDCVCSEVFQYSRSEICFSIAHINHPYLSLTLDLHACEEGAHKFEYLASFKFKGQRVENQELIEKLSASKMDKAEIVETSDLQGCLYYEPCPSLNSNSPRYFQEIPAISLHLVKYLMNQLPFEGARREPDTFITIENEQAKAYQVKLPDYHVLVTYDHLNPNSLQSLFVALKNAAGFYRPHNNSKEERSKIKHALEQHEREVLEREKVRAALSGDLRNERLFPDNLAAAVAKDESPAPNLKDL